MEELTLVETAGMAAQVVVVGQTLGQEMAALAILQPQLHLKEATAVIA
jgi:hypothetical protein